MDRDLVTAARHGDQAAFMDLARPRSNRLFAIALQILRDIDRAEDALQDALVIAWRDLRGLRDPDRFDAWLRKLLVNVCIREASRERRRAVNLRVLPIDGPAAPDDVLSIADRDQLERGFRRLPPDQRAILVLHHFLGYAPTEIAETLGIPPGTDPKDFRGRYVFLDIPVGGKLLIIVDSAHAADFESLLAEAMPIVESFQFKLEQ